MHVCIKGDFFFSVTHFAQTMNYIEDSRNFIVCLSKESKNAFAYPQSVREINKLLQNKK